MAAAISWKILNASSLLLALGLLYLAPVKWWPLYFLQIRALGRCMSGSVYHGSLCQPASY